MTIRIINGELLTQINVNAEDSANREVTGAENVSGNNKEREGVRIMALQIDETDHKLITEHGFMVSESGNHYVLRDPANKGLGGKGRIESGNLTELIFRAIAERKDAGITAPPRAAGARKPVTLPPTLPAQTSVTAASTGQLPGGGIDMEALKNFQPAEPDTIEAEELDDSGGKTRKPKRESKPRDTSAMDAVYDAVIDGVAPGKVHDTLVKRGVALKSSTSTYTHAAIANRVIKRALAKGWKDPQDK